MGPPTRKVLNPTCSFSELFAFLCLQVKNNFKLSLGQKALCRHLEEEKEHKLYFKLFEMSERNYC